MEQLGIIEKNGANYILFEVSGELTTYTATEFQEKMFETIQHSNIVLDLSSLVAIDSVGIGIIMATLNDGEEYGHKFYMMNPSPAARQALEETGFYDTFEFIHSVTEMS